MIYSEGMMDNNAVLATFPMGIELTYFTLIELMDFTDIFFERIKRQESGPDVLKYKALNVNVVVDSSGREYQMGTDFVLDGNGSIVWKASKGPIVNKIYSIHYEAAVQFRAMRSAHSNRFAKVFDKGEVSHLKLPEQWLLQKEFLVKRTAMDGSELPSNTILEPEED